MSFAFIPFVKIGKKSKNSLFSDFKRIFFIFGGVVTKNAFSKMFPILKDDFFDTRLILSQHPHQVFCYFDNIFFEIFDKQFTFSMFWTFIHHITKFVSHHTNLLFFNPKREDFDTYAYAKVLIKHLQKIFRIVILPVTNKLC